MAFIKYFIGFWLLIAMILDWLFDMIEQIVKAIHGGFNGAALALQRKYNEYGKSDK